MSQRSTGRINDFRRPKTHSARGRAQTYTTRLPRSPEPELKFNLAWHWPEHSVTPSAFRAGLSRGQDSLDDEDPTTVRFSSIAVTYGSDRLETTGGSAATNDEANAGLDRRCGLRGR